MGRVTRTIRRTQPGASRRKPTSGWLSLVGHVFLASGQHRRSGQRLRSLSDPNTGRGPILIPRPIPRQRLAEVYMCSLLLGCSSQACTETSATQCPTNEPTPTGPSQQIQVSFVILNDTDSSVWMPDTELYSRCEAVQIEYLVEGEDPETV